MHGSGLLFLQQGQNHRRLHSCRQTWQSIFDDHRRPLVRLDACRGQPRREYRRVVGRCREAVENKVAQAVGDYATFVVLHGLQGMRVSAEHCGTVAEGDAVAVGAKGEDVGEGGSAVVGAGTRVTVGGTRVGVAELGMVTRVTGGTVRAGAEVAQAARASAIAAG
jgi:hypothetical protein